MSDRDERRNGRPFKSGPHKSAGRPGAKAAGGKSSGKSFAKASGKFGAKQGGNGPDKGPARDNDGSRPDTRGRSSGYGEKSANSQRPSDAKRGAQNPVSSDASREKKFGEPRRAPVRVYGERPKFGDRAQRDAAPRVAAPRLSDRTAEQKISRAAPVFTSDPTLGEPVAQEKPVAQGERIAKVIARVGLCSRRDAEMWIEQGRVAVNGRILDSAALNVSDKDKVSVDGKPLAARESTRLFLFHKPRGYVTTDRDPEGRPTIFDWLAHNHPNLPRLMTIGRLDINTEGLLLMTNDGGLARVLELPKTGWLRRYRVRAHGETNQAALDTLRRGVTIDDVDYLPIEARLDREQGTNAWITIGLREGKNREVRRVLAYLGLEVNRLIRISFGPFQLGDLIEGDIDEVKTRILRDQLGEALIEQAGADFAAPVEEQRLISRHDRETRAKYSSGADDRDAKGGRGKGFGDKRASGKREGFSREKPAGVKSFGDKSARKPGDFKSDASRQKFSPDNRNDRSNTRDERRPAPRERENQEEAPEKRAARPLPGARKHVSALRAERETRQIGERVKVERGATQDRKGRPVAVERVRAADAKGEFEPVNRNGRRFATERQADRPKSDYSKTDRPQSSRSQIVRKPGEGRSGARNFGEKSGGGSEARTGERFGERSQRPVERTTRRTPEGDAAPRRFTADRSERSESVRAPWGRSDGAKAPSRENSQRSPRRAEGSSPARRDESSRAPRREDGPRAPRPYGDARPSGGARSEARDTRPARENRSNRGDSPQRNDRPGENAKRPPSRNPRAPREDGARPSRPSSSGFSRGTGGPKGPSRSGPKGPPREKR